MSMVLPVATTSNRGMVMVPGIYNVGLSASASAAPLGKPDIRLLTKLKMANAAGAVCNCATPLTVSIGADAVTESRRSAKYEASVWDDDFMQALTSPYSAEKFIKQAEQLKREVKVIIDSTEHMLDQLELIDNLQRLGISNHFPVEVHKLLDGIYRTVACNQGRHTKLDLYTTAIQFRLLRQHGYHVPQEAFCSFMDETGNFQACLAGDVRGLLSLHEASFLSMEGETILDMAKDFTTHHLKQRLEQSAQNASVANQIRHALGLPPHWRVQTLEARWFIHVYQARPDANPILLQLAKLVFNMVQAEYQEEIKHLSRWYKETRLSEKLGFARQRLAEGFFWALGFTPELHLSYSRRILCKVAVLVMIADDIYDLYGTRDELEVLTETIQRWDINGLDSLPVYMKIYFLAIFNSATEMAYDVLRDQGFNIIPHLRRLWAELCRAFNLEARWYRNGYLPGVKEYLDTAWISSTGPLVLLHAYLSIADPINMKELERLEKYPGIVRWPSMIFRLTNDLATTNAEMKRGDAPSSIQCYMHETGCSEEDARHYIKQIIDLALKRMNKELVMEKGKGMNESFCTSAMNLARIVQCLYQLGDGLGIPHRETKQNLVSLIVEPIPIP